MKKLTRAWLKALLNTMLALGTGAIVTGGHGLMAGNVSPATVLVANVTSVVLGLAFLAIYVVGSIILVAYCDSG